MRYVKQIGIIMGITLAGEVLNHVVPLPVPAGVLLPKPYLNVSTRKEHSESSLPTTRI